MQNGTIPESYSESSPGTENAEATWICFFAGRRRSDSVDSSLRYHERAWSVRRDAECNASSAEIVDCFCCGFKSGDTYVITTFHKYFEVGRRGDDQNRQTNLGGSVVFGDGIGGSCRIEAHVLVSFDD